MATYDPYDITPHTPQTRNYVMEQVPRYHTPLGLQKCEIFIWRKIILYSRNEKNVIVVKRHCKPV